MKSLKYLQKKLLIALCVLCLTFVFSSCQPDTQAGKLLETLEHRYLVGAKRLTTDELDFSLECFSEGDDYLFASGETIRVGNLHTPLGYLYHIWDLDQLSKPLQHAQTESFLSFHYGNAKLKNALWLNLVKDTRFGWEINKKILFYIEDMNADGFLPSRYNYDAWLSDDGELTILDQCATKADGETSYAAIGGENIPIVFVWNDDKTFQAYETDGDGMQTQNIVLSGTYENTFMHTTLHISEDNLFGGIETLNLTAERYGEQ
jgi:hypothetical protein